MMSPDDSVPAAAHSVGAKLLGMIRRLVPLAALALAVVLLGHLVVPGKIIESSHSKHITADEQTRMLRSALDTMRLDLGRYPTTEEGLALLVTRPRDSALAERWHGPYIESAVPPDPWGQPFHYSVPGKDPYPFALYSNGPDQSAGMVIGYPPPD